MGKKKMSGSREPRKPKKDKARKLAVGTADGVLIGEKATFKGAK